MLYFFVKLLLVLVFCILFLKVTMLRLAQQGYKGGHYADDLGGELKLLLWMWPPSLRNRRSMTNLGSVDSIRIMFIDEIDIFSRLIELFCEHFVSAWHRRSLPHVSNVISGCLPRRIMRQNQRHSFVTMRQNWSLRLTFPKEIRKRWRSWRPGYNSLQRKLSKMNSFGKLKKNVKKLKI